MKILRPFLYFSALASPALAADSSFDRWAEHFSAEWMRANPSHACVDKIGLLTVLELRARPALGSNFKIKKFPCLVRETAMFRLPFPST